MLLLLIQQSHPDQLYVDTMLAFRANRYMHPSVGYEVHDQVCTHRHELMLVLSQQRSGLLANQVIDT